MRSTGPLKQWCSTFSFHGTHKQMTKILWHTQKYVFFANLKGKKGVVLNHSHWTAIVVLAVVRFLFDNFREKRSVALTK